MSYFKEEDWEEAEEASRLEGEYFATVNYIWQLAEVYELPLTNNVQRMQDGIFLREVGSFIEDTMLCMIRAGWTPPEGFVDKLHSSSKEQVEQAINTYRKRREFRDSSG